jgi:hypothetical protein
MKIELSDEFVVQCATCGKEVEASVSLALSGKRLIEIEPCEGCLRDAEANGETNATAQWRDDVVQEIRAQVLAESKASGGLS